MTQCQDLTGDRLLGGYWEQQFCGLASGYGRSFTAHQLKREGATRAGFKWNGRYHFMTMPDITLLTSPGEHHEIKHKDPSAKGLFGLERYRLDALVWFWRETGQNVYYTIHDYSRQPDLTRKERKMNQSNFSEHWVTSPISELSKGFESELGQSYVNGRTDVVSICYWPKGIFKPLIALWQLVPSRDNKGHLTP